ncbi:hypothetical protein DM194_00545 [Azospirillum ramasamyi]|uniref:Uncharacterized protein n=1 Tax=Azospirillum ramasamyi TaxID=682998 RepID=A0A2U9S192_9PROT|nr:hypothetical protein DM194_00545 [Azospirillum ramasamyi]
MASNHPSKARAVADAARGESPDRRNSDHRKPDYRKPDYRKIAHELAQLGQEAANRAHATGNGRYARLAHTLTSRAGEILNDLDRGGKA